MDKSRQPEPTIPISPIGAYALKGMAFIVCSIVGYIAIAVVCMSIAPLLEWLWSLV